MDTLIASARTDLRFALEVLLREEPGINVIGTATGTEGLLALIQISAPDLVIMDWELPGRPAVDVLVAARVSAPTPYIIVLVKDGGPWQTARSAGANACVERGGPPEELLAAVRQARAWRAVADDAKPTHTKGE